MKISRLVEWTLAYKLFNSILFTIQYIKDKIKIGDIFYSTEFKNLIKKYINVNLENDWIGRQYAIINPIIDIDGNLDINRMIIEINGDATNNLEQVKIWIYRQLSLIGQLFRLQGLYDYIDVEIKHVGPINADNYLIIFDIASRQRLAYFLKKTIWQSILYIILFGTFYYFVL